MLFDEASRETRDLTDGKCPCVNVDLEQTGTPHDGCSIVAGGSPFAIQVVGHVTGQLHNLQLNFSARE
jgi:hypothetical protein